jgi:hypothetical protein
MEAIEGAFLGAPVEALPPVIYQVAEVGQGYPILPGCVGRFVWPADVRQALLQVIKDGLWDVDGEWPRLQG